MGPAAETEMDAVVYIQSPCERYDAYEDILDRGTFALAAKLRKFLV
jgi:hypothetical protein